MKKLLSLVLAIVMITGCMSVTGVFAADISVTIDGNAQSYDVMPVIENGRTLVPMRAIFEALGAEISWDDTTKTVTGKKDDTIVTLQIGNKNATVNGANVTLDVEAKILNGRTLVPVRFVSETMGCNVGWDDATRTVIIETSKNNNLAKLISTYHRPVPVEFTKSNDLNDILHFGEMTQEEQEKAYKIVKSAGEIVCTEDKFLESISTTGPEYGTSEVVSVEGQPFKKALRITCAQVPEKSAGFISRTAATPEKNPGDGVNGKDIMLLAFRMRTVSTDAADGLGKVQVQIEHPETYSKALFKFATSGKDWKVIYLPFTGIDNATSIGIRGGFAKQVVELGGIEIINLGTNYDMGILPTSEQYSEEFEPDAPWRKEANERIEKIRKGDFTVIVKDKGGNVVSDAEVELDMFEHEFQFGNLIKSAMHGNENYMKNLSSLFNAAVVEHSLKWAPYEEKPQDARWQVDEAKAAGIKYLRGHSIFWERKFGSNGVTYMTPEYMFEESIMNGTNKAKYDELCKKHIDEVCAAFKGEFVDWDVLNEIVEHNVFESIYGAQTWKDQFEWVRQADSDAKLYYNDYMQHDDKFYPVLDKLVASGADFDGIGIQSHYDTHQEKPTDIIAMYNKLDTYGKELKVTEFSCSFPDLSHQANFTRDTLIASFAQESIKGFLCWGMWDGSNYAAYSPFFDKDWKIKPAGLQYIDLVYNKWWTRDAKATTNAEGKAVIRGFYGDYDVTVNVGGKTYTDMVAFHKGYENVLEITIE